MGKILLCNNLVKIILTVMFPRLRWSCPYERGGPQCTNRYPQELVQTIVINGTLAFAFVLVLLFVGDYIGRPG